MPPRKALLVASLSRYTTFVLQAGSLLTVAHFLPPDLFGLTVLGSSVRALASAVRELGSTSYLVQQRALEMTQIRSAVTITVLITLAVAALMLAGAGAIAGFYRDERLAAFVQLLTVGYVLEAFYNPVAALLQREMAFGRLALLEVLPTAIGAATTIALVMRGGSYMSVAWAMLAQSMSATLLAALVKPRAVTMRPSLRDWRGVLTFGFYGGATAIIYRLGETLLFLLLGWVLNAGAVGLLQRSYVITQIPERVLLAGVGAVALPMFARLSREDAPLAPAYLYSVALVTPVYLAAVLALVPLAPATVMLLLGPAWTEAIPLVRIIAAGHLIGIAASLNIMVLIGIGHIQSSTPLVCVQIAILLLCVGMAAPFGVEAVAWTTFVTVPLNTMASFWFVRRHIRFGWGELAAAIWPGIPAALGCGIGAALVPLAAGGAEVPPVLVLLGGVLLGGGAWLLALRASRHPLLAELLQTVDAVIRRLHRA